MRKKYYYFLLFLACLLPFIGEGKAAANEGGPLLVGVAEKVPIYDNSSGSLVKVGELVKGEVYQSLRPFEKNWYEITFGNSTGYVPSKDVKVVTDAELRNEKTIEVLSGESIKAQADLIVYDNSTGSLIPFAVISKDVQYPIISPYGNWYKIDMAGRIGFVHKNDTLFFGKPEEKPPASQGKVLEIVSERAKVYDNRSGSLVKVGELFKGQTFRLLRPFGENWWEISFGDAKGYIARVKAKEAPGASIIAENKYYAPLGDVVKITTDTTVVDNSTGSLLPFAKITSGTSYPILSVYGNWYRIDVAGKIGYIHKNNTVKLPNKIAATNAKKVPVLMYHHLLQKRENIFPNNNVILNVENFAEQMNYLSRYGYQTISLADMENYLKGRIKLKDKTVLITFDDGLKTNHFYALPILKQYGFQAGAFIITDRITPSPSHFIASRSQSLSEPEINEMKSHFQIGSHTAALHQLQGYTSYVLTKTDDEVLSDFVRSKQFVNTGYFCYPFGQYSEKTIGLLKKAGYTSAYTTKTGYAVPGTNTFEIPRFGVYPYTTMSDFAAIVSGSR